jgi:hypothetical protein
MNWYERDSVDDSVGLDLTGDNTVRHWSQLPPAPIYPRLFDRPAEAKPATTTDLQELRDPTPAVARGREPDATVPEFTTTLKLDEDDLFEVREVEDRPVELPINPGIRVVGAIAKVALPLAVVAGLTLVVTPAERTAITAAPPPVAARAIAFGTLQRLDVGPAAAEAQAPAATVTTGDVVAVPPVAQEVAKADAPGPRHKPQVKRRRPRQFPRVIQPTARQLRRYKRALSSARRALRRQHWAKARARAAAALDILPRDRRARAIKRLAERKLRGGRRYL